MSRSRRTRPALSLKALVPQLLVVAALVGGTTAFVSYDKTVTVTVDGTSHTVHTFAGSVASVLDREGVKTGPHDSVEPSRTSSIGDGQHVQVRYGRLLNVTVDTHPQQVWVTARTVDEALAQMQLRADGAYLSVPRTTPISRGGLTFEIRTERTVTFLVDGRTVPVRTNAATVQDAMTQAGVTLGPQDRTSVPLDSFPAEGTTVSVLRVTGTSATKDEPIPFDTVKQNDPTAFTGTQTVVTKGVPGLKRTTYAYETVDGVKQPPRVVNVQVVTPPVTQVIKVGTKTLPNSVAGADGLDWGGLAQCEAGGNPHAVDPSGTYSGLYQFDAQTWQSLGGTGTAGQASASEQTYRAKLLYVQRGSSPWPVCGSRLYS